MEPPPDSEPIAARLAELSARVDAAALTAGRDPTGVRILLATKTVEPARILQALDAGYSLLGENRVQELLGKVDALSGRLHQSHFIGHLQSNKAASLLGRIDCLQTLDSLNLARRLQDRLSAMDGALEVMVQVNVSGEASKSGITPEEAPAFLAGLADLDRLTVRGYMTIGLNSDDPTAVRAGYSRLRELRDAAIADELPGAAGAVELSMGMSGDFDLAIAEGATIVRLGSAVFGGRPPLRAPLPPRDR